MGNSKSVTFGESNTIIVDRLSFEQIVGNFRDIHDPNYSLLGICRNIRLYGFAARSGLIKTFQAWASL